MTPIEGIPHPGYSRLGAASRRLCGRLLYARTGHGNHCRWRRRLRGVARSAALRGYEARLRGARLNIVHAWVMPVFESVPDPFLVEWSGPVDPDPEATINAIRQGAETVLGGAMSEAGRRSQGLEMEKVVIEDRPERALVDAAPEPSCSSSARTVTGGFTTSCSAPSATTARSTRPARSRSSLPGATTTLRDRSTPTAETAGGPAVG